MTIPARLPRQLVIATLLCVALSQAMAAESPLEAAIGGGHRTPDYTQRDAARHPRETLAFFGVKPDMTVVEIWPGGGWYTEMLAPLLRERGKFYAAHFNADSTSKYYRESRATFDAKLAATPAIYDRVVVTTFNPPQYVDIAPPGSADLVLTFRNVHNWYMRGGGDERVIQAFEAMHRALKPGGVLGVVDHRLPASRALEDQEDSGYMREDYVIAMAQRAGFVLAAKSEINANPKDTANHPEGVWTLPPTLRLGDVDRDKYQAIGESDRMTLKFVKPKS
jgi:predicted methyltransferase